MMSDVVGHDLAKQHLIANPQVRSWLLCGDRGIGKAKLANSFAHFLLSAEGLGYHPDIMAIKEDGESFIDVGQVRQLKGFLSLSPSVSSRKIAIIDSVDRLGEGAINAILKVLEEPSHSSVLLLISHKPHALPATLISRCVSLHLSRLSREQTLSVLADRFTTEEVLALYEGTPGLISDSIEKELAFYHLIVATITGDIRCAGELSKTELAVDKIHRIFGQAFLKVAKDSIIISRDTKSHIKSLLDTWDEINNLLVHASKLHLNKEQLLLSILPTISCISL